MKTLEDTESVLDIANSQRMKVLSVISSFSDLILAMLY